MHPFKWKWTRNQALKHTSLGIIKWKSLSTLHSVYCLYLRVFLIWRFILLQCSGLESCLLLPNPYSTLLASYPDLVDWGLRLAVIPVKMSQQKIIQLLVEEIIDCFILFTKPVKYAKTNADCCSMSNNLIVASYPGLKWSNQKTLKSGTMFLMMQ